MVASLIEAEKVSAFLDYRRMSPVTRFLADGYETFTSQLPRENPRRHVAESRAASGSCEGGFTRSVLGANASLDDIATQAGVGPGTLFATFLPEMR